MKFKAFGRNLTQQTTATIKGMIKVVTDEEAEIYDLDSFDVEVNSNDVLFLYGPRAIRETSSFKYIKKIEFADIHIMQALFKDNYEKEKAFNKLQLFKKQLALRTENNTALASTSTIEDLLPEYNSNQIEALEASLKEKRITEWLGTLSDGRSFRITLKPETRQQDIEITFAELYALKTLKEVLRIEELEFVSTNFHSSKGNSK